MNQTGQLVDTLKRVLKARGLTYASVAQQVGLSEASVKRLFAEQSFSLQKLEKFCAVLEIDFFELAKLARGALDSQDALSHAQEQVLADSPRLLAVFYLVYNHWQLADILARYQITEAEALSHLLQLTKLGIIDLLPNNLIRLRVSRGLSVRHDGPIRAQHGQHAMDDFLSVHFQEHGGYFRFEFRELSPASFEIFKRKLDRLAADFLELADIDSTLPPTQRQSIGIGLGVRPWEMGLVTGLHTR